VSVAGREMMHVGHAYAAHGCLIHAPHGAVLASGAAHASLSGAPIGRIGDAVSCGSAGMQGEGSVTIGDNGGEEYRREFWKDHLADPKDQLVLCLSEMAAAQAEEVDEINRRGWIYLHEFVEKWLSRKTYVMQDAFDNGGQDPSWVDWDWLKQYARFNRAVNGLLEPGYLFGLMGKRRLAEILEKDGAFAGQGTTFDHLTLTHEYTWRELRTHAFQSKSMSFSRPEILDPGFAILPDGLYAAIGNVTVYALAQGETKVENGKKDIIVRQVGLFIHDGIEFNGEQQLGNWECLASRKGFSITGEELNNRAFRDFRDRTGYGCDFRIMCLPHLVDIEVFSYDAP
jgi:hypothetical protein